MTIKNNPNLVIILVVIIGVILSSLSGWFLYKVKEKAIISEFHKDVNERASSLYREVAINFEALRSLAILFNGDTIPEYEQLGRKRPSFSTMCSHIYYRYPTLG